MPFPSFGSKSQLKEYFASEGADITPTETESEGDVNENVNSEKKTQYGSVQNVTPTKKFLRRTQSTFWQDAVMLKEGSIPQSIVVAAVIGVVCGVAANYYYKILEWLLEYFWKTLPEQVVIGYWPEWSYPLWIPLVGAFMAIGVGLTVKYMGEPGD